jgi:hypothetical protein
LYFGGITGAGAGWGALATATGATGATSSGVGSGAGGGGGAVYVDGASGCAVITGGCGAGRGLWRTWGLGGGGNGLGSTSGFLGGGEISVAITGAAAVTAVRTDSNCSSTTMSAACSATTTAALANLDERPALRHAAGGLARDGMVWV